MVVLVQTKKINLKVTCMHGLKIFNSETMKMLYLYYRVQNAQHQESINGYSLTATKFSATQGVHSYSYM